jgi:hypothetical protein
VSSRRTLPGTPATSERGGITCPSSTTVPPARSDSRPTTAPFITVADMPTMQSSSIVQPCRTALWPTLTPAPTVSGKPGSTWQLTLSCRLERAPITMSAASARSTALNHTLDPAPSVTRPITRAPADTRASGAIPGAGDPGSARTVAWGSTVMRTG